MSVCQVPSDCGDTDVTASKPSPALRSIDTGTLVSEVRPCRCTLRPAATVADGTGSSVTNRTSTSPTMPRWIAQWYMYIPGAANDQVNCFPTSRSPESNVPSSAVTVCVRPPLFDHVIVSPGSASMAPGKKDWYSTVTGSVAASARPGASATAAAIQSATATAIARIDGPTVRPPRVTASPCRCRSSHASCGPRRDSGRARYPDPARGGTDGLCVTWSAVGVDPPVAVDMKCVVVGTHRHHIPLDRLADLRPKHGGVADERSPVDRHEVLAER